MHSKAGKAGDEWQLDSVEGQMRMRLLPLAVPLFIPMRANLGPAGCSAIWVFAPECFSLLQSSLDNAPYERCFRGASALFLWKLCERFQIAADFAAQTANALTQFDVSVSYLIRFEHQ
jgi:hypothetical protein